ncbi:FAD-dependent monooxygenase [Streptomyces sp. SCA3-4]|uniref:FAD-dependent oxidoreductase n=1 Tax=Streptomyces sichuanensis TaxID=2871810 RepID=UPI001CE27AC3|nr:FAD-dependent monooxygenase [Streptomyces sichuanensis]MCA6092508.1 FAD-dependent monooxygenase [Streptomyces sichuanensis]
MDPVIVVGAGPVGLTLALALARYEVPVTVLDEAPPGSAGQDDRRLARTAVLRPETAALLERLGCATTEGTRWTGWRTLRRRAEVARVAFAAPAGSVKAEERDHDELLEYGESGGFGGSGGPGEAGDFGDAGSPGDARALGAEPSPLHLPQHALTRELRAALGGEADVRIVQDSRLTLLKQDSSGVTVHTRGDNGTVWRASYLVGCDGARSVVRKLLGARFPGRTAVERYAVAALRAELPWPGEAVLHRSPPRGDEVTARPLPDGVWRLDWPVPSDGRLVTPDALLARVRDALSLWCGEVPAYDLLDTGVHAVHHRLARRWRSGRAFLAGDAAHLLGALGTQGLDEGLRDAENLAWKLALAWHHGASDTLLDSYQAERREAVAARLRAADRTLPTVRGEGGWHTVRRTVVPRAARAHDVLLTDGHLGRGLLGAPQVHTRTPLAPAAPPAGSVLVGTAVGALVTDVPVTAPDGSETQLHDRLGGKLLVVLVAPGTGVWERRHWLGAGLMPRLAAAVSALPLQAELLVTEGYPGADAHTVLVVRPDGFLVAALAGVRPAELYACADATRGGATGPTPASAKATGGERVPEAAAGAAETAGSEATANR